ncbi:MAG: peptidase T, partial [Spirochaetales bacterium]|nr:peptidase T [Spirochaetales bacterium]
MNFSTDWFQDQLLDRFVRYACIFTTSDRHVDTIPSTPGQWDLLNLLVEELREIGIDDIDLTEKGFLIARIPAATGKENAPVIGFMAHVDTVSDASGENVKPRIHKDYDGKPIVLED